MIWSALVLGLGVSVASGPSPPDSLTLERALALARERSPALTAAAAAVEEAEAGESGARAARGPRLSVDGTYLRYQDAPSVSLGAAGSYAPYDDDNFLLRLGVTQPLYTSGRISAGLRAADRGRRAAEASAAFAEVELTARVAEAHNDALLARARLDVARQAVEVLEEAVRVAREHYGSGAVARLDVLRAETRLSAVRAELRAAEAAVRDAEEGLAALVGLEPGSAPPVAGRLEYAPVGLDPQPLEATSVGRRPDLRALQARAGAAEAAAEAVRARRLPAVSLFATALTSRPEPVTGREAWASDLLAGVRVSWPFFDWGRTDAEARAAEATAARLRADAERVADSVGAALRGRLRALERAARDVEEGRENVTRAERVLTITRDRYAEGVGIQLDVLEAEAELRRARAALFGAIHAHRSAAFELRRILGLPADTPLPGGNGAGETERVEGTDRGRGTARAGEREWAGGAEGANGSRLGEGDVESGRDPGGER